MRLRLVAIPLIAAFVLAAAAGATRPDGGGGGGSEPSQAPPDGGAVFVLTGSGFGHGVGLSQYGARAQALVGKSAADILGFYYPGTSIATQPSRTVRVLLVQAATSLAVAAPVSFTVRDAAGAVYPLPAGTTTIAPDLQVSVNGVRTQLAGPLTFAAPTGSLLSLGGKTYRGKLELSSTGKQLQAIDVVGLDAYVQGVVPGEMPSTWPVAALQAQAIAARSYALASIVKGKSWDLYPDGRSQQYLGASAETPQTTAAVTGTAREVVLYGGRVATTFYSSSSGGRTASAIDTFGLDLAYLPTEPDPWDDSSPYHTWAPASYTGQQLAKGLGLKARVVDVTSQMSDSDRVASLVAVAADGSSLELSGSEVRSRLALRSTAFHLGTLRFLTPGSPASPGTKVLIAGIARDVEAPRLERLAPSGLWTPVVNVLTVQPDGSFSVVVKPKQTTTYRLSASGLPGPALTIPVIGASS
jgi:stage II sporulation protein D